MSSVSIQSLPDEPQDRRWYATAQAEDGTPMFDGVGATPLDAVVAMAQQMADEAERRPTP